MSPIRISNSSEVEPLDTDCPVDLIALEEDFCLRHKTIIEFSLNINDIIKCEAVKQF